MGKEAGVLVGRLLKSRQGIVVVWTKESGNHEGEV